jgi:large subunit ribosomal protein L32
MPVPKRKRSRARRDSRFANKGITPCTLAACAQCQAPLSMHQACGLCGFYKGRKVMKTKLDRVIQRREIRTKKKHRNLQIKNKKKGLKKPFFT